MPAPFAIRRHPAVARRMDTHADQWRCSRCFKLLGRRDGDRVHLRFTQGHEYFVHLPATAVCRSCGTLNELKSTTRA